MTHPTRPPASALTAADAMRRITDREMTEMCLAVNMQMGSAAANKLLDLFGAARRSAKTSSPPEAAVRADLAPTDAQVMAPRKVKALMEALRDIADPARLASHGDPTVLRDRARAALRDLEGSNG